MLSYKRITVVSTSSLSGARMAICWYHVGAMSIWQYYGHILTEAATDGAEADLRGMIGTLLPEAREQVGHVEGPAQLRQTTIIAKEVPSLTLCNCGQEH